MTAKFCPRCGRQRTGSQFCAGCGRDFGGAVAGGGGDHQGRGRALWLIVAVIVALAAGGGSYALLRSTGTAQPDGAPALVARTSAPPTAPAGTGPASTGPSAPLASPSTPVPAASTAASSAPPSPPTPKPTPPTRVVRLPAGAGAAAGPVEVVLTHYFQGINKRDYAEYASSETAQGQANEPESAFDSGYATTTDSAMRVTTLTEAGGGDLIATVTFTSRQSPSDSVDSSACNDWTLYFYLVPNGGGYLIAPAPSGYESTYTDC